MAAIELHHPDAATAELLDGNQTAPPSHWISYFTKASFLCVLLYAGSVVAPSLPLPGVAVLWAAVSVIATITPLYMHVVLRKTVRHQQLQPDSTFFKLNNGRKFSLDVDFRPSLVLRIVSRTHRLRNIRHLQCVVRHLRSAENHPEHHDFLFNCLPVRRMLAARE